jgi:hypothetical protein
VIAGPEGIVNEADEIKADIERTRADLAGTVDSLTTKLGGVKPRVAQHARQAAMLAGGAVLALWLVTRLAGRRRH